MSNFVNVARAIINESFKKTVLIDDEAVLPFSQEEDKSNLCKDLYLEFSENSCMIDFIPFKNENEIDKTIKRLNLNYDLVLLDWELVQNEPTHQHCIKILNEIIKRGNSQFVCVYTHLQKESFDEIIYRISGFFCGELVADYSGIIEAFETDSGYNFKDLYAGKFKDLVLKSSGTSKIYEELSSDIKRKSTKAYEAIIKLNKNNRIESFKQFGFTLNGIDFFSFDEKKIQIKILIDYDCIIIKNTIVILHNKKDLKPDKFTEGFANSIINMPQSFLTILNLEVRNAFIEHSSIITSDIFSINEHALFYHRNDFETNDEFQEFINEIWKNESLNFLKTFEPKAIKYIEDYKSTKGIVIDQAKLKSDQKFIADMGVLNCYYNLLSHKIRDTIQFGDIFHLYDVLEDELKYLLCITAHCDCLTPKNIKNRFLFVEGRNDFRLSTILKKLSEESKEFENEFSNFLENLDSHFVSFIDINDPQCISWSCKPFSIHIATGQNNIKNCITVTLDNKKFVLKYICTLKENYAQRIANQSYSHANRVGISFAKIKN